MFNFRSSRARMAMMGAMLVAAFSAAQPGNKTVTSNKPSGRIYKRRWFTSGWQGTHNGARETLRRRCGGFHMMRRMAAAGRVWDDHQRQYIPKESV